MITHEQAERCVTHHHACDCREYQFQDALAVGARIENWLAEIITFSLGTNQPPRNEYNCGLTAGYATAQHELKALLTPSGDAPVEGAVSEHLPPPKPEQPLPPDYTKRGTSAMRLTDAQRNALEILVDSPPYAPWKLTHRIYPFGGALLERLEQRGLVEHTEGLDIGVSEFRWRITPAGRAALEGRPGTDSPRGEFG